MFSKSFGLVFFSCMLALVNSAQEAFTSQPQNVVDIGSSLEQIHTKIIKTFTQAVESFVEPYEALAEANKKVQKYDVSKVKQLRCQFHTILGESKEMISEVENSIFMGTIVNLQKAVDDLRILYSTIIDQTKKGTDQNAQPEKQVANDEEHPVGIQRKMKKIGSQTDGIDGLFEGFDNTINNSSQTLSIIESQLASAVTIQIDEVNERLTKWKNNVDHFLASTVNSKPKYGLPKGRFSAIGQQIGGHIDGAVDKFTSTAGIFIDNVVKTVG